MNEGHEQTVGRGMESVNFGSKIDGAHRGRHSKLLAASNSGRKKERGFSSPMNEKPLLFVSLRDFSFTLLE